MEECTLWLQVKQRLLQSCSDFDSLWVKRKRIFNTETIVRSLLQLVGGSCQSYHRAMDALELASIPAASSFCDARARFPSFILSELRKDVLDEWDEHVLGRRWHDYRVYAVDGSRINLPRELMDEGFRIPGTGYYPQGLASILVRLDDRTVCDIRLAKREDERKEAHEHLVHLSANDLVVYDRGYLSFALLVAHVRQGAAAVFRVAKGTSFEEIEEFWVSEKLDAVVTIDPCPHNYLKVNKQYPDYSLTGLELRLIKYKIAGETYVLATTILDSCIPRQEFISLYSYRWWSEETYKTYKQTLKLEAFHSKSEAGVRQELEATALLWNLTRFIATMAEPDIKKQSRCLISSQPSGQLSAEHSKSGSEPSRSFFHR